MTELVLQKWDSVIVDWVNCLELSQHIQNINGLQSGNFFKALINLLQPELPTSIREFIQISYPCFKIPGEDDNFNNGDLTAVASLLLHFSCIYDRRDQLIKPLCNKLPGSVQIQIRYFLEKFTTETTYKELDEVIKQSVECESVEGVGANPYTTPKSCVLEWNSSGESAHCNSPLLEYFKTPAAKTAKMQEKDREIKQLQKDLQLERFEKEDMGAEMKEQKDRIRKISKEVHEKSLIISNLSAKLAELEEDPPTSKPREVIEIEKLLRSELADSQEYITQLQNEHGEIIMRNEDIAKKLARAEENACTWQTKAVQYESKLEQLSAKYLSQELELTHLQMNYNELSALLDELRQSKANTSGYELDASSSVTTLCTTTQEPKSSDEDLAATVVEVQLKECQLEIQSIRAHSNGINLQLQQTLEELEECRKTCKTLETMKHDVELALDRHILTNDQLDSRVNELTAKSSQMHTIHKELEDDLQASLERSQQLEDELMETKLRLDDLNNNNSSLQLNNEELMEKVVTLQQSEEGLLATNADIVKRVEEMTHENGIKDEQLGNLRGQLQVREQVIINHEELISSLRNDFQMMETFRNDLQTQLDERNRNYGELERESRALQVKYEEAVENFNQTDFNLQALRKQIKESDNKMQVNIDRLETLITGAIESSENDKFQRFHILLEQLASKQSSFESTIENSKELNGQLDAQIEHLRQTEVTNRETLETLEKSLVLAQQALKDFEEQIEEKVLKIQELEAILKQVTAESEDLTYSLDLVKNESASRLQQNEFLTSRLDELQIMRNKLEDKLTDVEEQVNSLEHDKEQLIQKVETTEEENLAVEKRNSDLEKSIVDLKTAQENLANQLANAQGVSRVFEGKLAATEEEILEKTKANEDLSLQITELKQLHQDMLQKLSIANEVQSQNATTIKKLNKTVKDIQSAHDSLLQKFVTLEEQNSQKVETIKDLNKSTVTLQNAHKKVLSDLALSDEKNSEHIQTNQKLENTILDLRHIQTDLQREVQRLQDELSLSKNTSETYKNTLEVLQPKYGKACEEMDTLKESLRNLDALKHNLQEEITILKGQATDHERKYQELLQRFEVSQSKVALMFEQNGALKTTIDEIQSINANLTEEIGKLQTSLKEQTHLNEELLNKCEKLQDEGHSHLDRCEEYKNEVISLQEEKSTLYQKLNTEKQHTHELNLTIGNLKGEGDQIAEKHRQLTVQYHTLAISHDTLTSSYETIRTEFSISKKENESSKQKIDELLLEINEQLAKFKDKDSELAFTKEEFLKKDLQQMQTINELNVKIDELEATKDGLQTDIQVIKDNLLLKQQECEDLQKSEKQLEKQLNKSTKQLEKKQHLMKLTMENLETKIQEMVVEKEQVEMALTREREKVVLLSGEKGRLNEDCNNLRNELHGLRERLKMKEQECSRKDDIIEDTNRELFAIKLDIELKSNELADCKSCVSSLEGEKSLALETANLLNNRFLKLDGEVKGTKEELKTIAQMRDSLTLRLDRLQENMQTVFSHFGVRRKSLKKCLDDIVKYKDNKEAEIKTLNGQLAEIRSEAEHLKEEGHSDRKEMEARIALGALKIQELEHEIDNLRIAESGCLQEISMLKEELNYTIDKYTEALQTEKDQKSENELQIQSLTEGVHDMLEKYNDLNKEHKQLTDEYNYNQKSFKELQSVKESLELEIVGLKATYEEDTKACRAEFDKELGALKKIEKNLHKEVKELKKVLKASTTDASNVRTELEDAKIQLRIIKEEKCELLQKIEDMKIENEEILDNYNAMNIANERLLKENKAVLLEMQDQLQTETHLRETTVGQKEKEMYRLHKEVNKLSERLKKEEEVFKQDIEFRQKEIDNLQTSVANFSQNIATLTKEKNDFHKKLEEKQALCEKLLGSCNEKDQLISEHEQQLRNLQISHDVLEAGKAKMEALQQELQERLSHLEDTQRREKLHFEATLSTLQSQLDKAHDQIKENEQLIALKASEIAASKEEYDTVQHILTNMTKKMSATSRQLSIIHEDYEGKLKSERESFAELQEQFATIGKEMAYMSSLNADLRFELDEAQRERTNAEIAIADKEELIAELQQKYDTVANLVSDKDATIASLQAELAEKLVQLANTATARRHLEDEHNVTTKELQSIKRTKEEMIETHAELMRNVEGEMAALVERTTELKLLCDISETHLTAERDARNFLERRVLDLEAQVHEAYNIRRKLVDNIQKFGVLLKDKEDIPDEEDLDEMILSTERRIVVIFNKLRDLGTTIEEANKDKVNANNALEQLTKCHEQLLDEKTKLLESYEKLHEEKLLLTQDKAKESKSLENLKMQYEALKDQQHHSTVLQNKLHDLELFNKQRYDSYNEFLHKTQVVFKDIENMVMERNQVEQIVCNLKDLYVTLQIKSAYITEDTHRLHHEQKSALEVIIDDIYKQFRRLSKMIYNLNLKCHQVVERTVSSIIEDKSVDWGILYKELSGDEILEKLEDLKDNAANALVQLETFTLAMEQLAMKEEKPRVLKENNAVPQSKPREDEWKKKYMSAKQKLTLVENSKNNFEKKVRQLREENKRLAQCKDKEESKDLKVEVEPKPQDIYENDAGYKKLLGEYICLKELHQKESTQWINKCQTLEQQIYSFGTKTAVTKNDQCEEWRRELDNVKESYMGLKLAFSKLELDHATLEKMLADRNEQLLSLTSTKETYSNLCEENTKLKAEIDTLTYKRHRDRDEFLQHIKKGESDIMRKVQNVREEYDLKLEKMREKIVSKYKEQLDQNEAQLYEEINMLKEENEHLRATVSKLKDGLGKALAKNDLLESEKHYALQQLKVQRDEFDFKEPAHLMRKASSQSLNEGKHFYTEERRSTFSLPRNVQSGMDVIEEVRYRRRTSIPPVSQEMEMEDECDMFNNKYLHDLKEGRPSLAMGRESSASRLSEFVMRNSLCPPHLKSSYPAETQFLDNVKFKDDDLKAGNLDFIDDTMKTQLLPVEKHKKKEGTSYKRPGPPTPSKHGGRPSMQGNERILRELTEQKRSTPNPLKSLFSSSKKDEGTVVSPRKRPGLSFFRR